MHIIKQDKKIEEEEEVIIEPELEKNVTEEEVTIDSRGNSETFPKDFSSSVTPKKCCSPNTTQYKRKKPAEDPRVTEAYNLMKDIASQPRDEYTAYGEYIANKLRKLNPYITATVQFEINRILYEAEMRRGQYNIYQEKENSNVSSFSPQENTSHNTNIRNQT